MSIKAYPAMWDMMAGMQNFNPADITLSNTGGGIVRSANQTIVSAGNVMAMQYMVSVVASGTLNATASNTEYFFQVDVSTDGGASWTASQAQQCTAQSLLPQQASAVVAVTAKPTGAILCRITTTQANSSTTTNKFVTLGIIAVALPVSLGSM